MNTVQRGVARPPTAASGAAPSRSRRLAAALAGPALIVASSLVAMRAFAFANLLTNQHPDILSFWLPRSCLMGRSLAAGHVPLWNPYEMAGSPFAADPQSGWLYLPWMLLSWLLPCGAGLRAFIVLQPILAGLGLYWFLRRERLHRTAATAGGLSLAMMIAASNVAISLPFAGSLAWTPFVLVGASGFLSADRWTRRLPWLALGAVAWGQVASAHLSHGLVMCTAIVTAFVVRIKVSFFVGFIGALPVLLFQFWRFITPGLEPREKRYAIPFVGASLGLFALGTLFAFLVLPTGIRFLLTFASSPLEPLIRIDEYLSFLMFMILAFGVSFEFPLVLVFLAGVGIMPSARLRKYRRHAVMGAAIVGAVATPSQDPYSMVVMAVPLYILYEISILVIRYAMKK